MTAEKNRRYSGEERFRAVELREDAINSQLTAAFTHCSVAESALALHRVQYGRDALENARRIVQVVRLHLDEPHHVPADSAAGLRNKVAELEKQISNIEERLKATGAKPAITIKIRV